LMESGEMGSDVYGVPSGDFPDFDGDG